MPTATPSPSPTATATPTVDLEATAAAENAQKLDSLLQQGQAAFDAGNFPQAVDRLSELIALAPNNAAAYYLRGRAYGYQGDLELAKADHTTAIELEPDHADAYSSRGLIHAAQGNIEQGLADSNTALDIDPGNAEAYVNRGMIYYWQEDEKQAISDLNQAIQLQPDYADAYLNRGSIHKNLGQPEQALADFSRVIELQPDAADAYYNRGVVYYEQGDPGQAIKDCARAIELDPELAVAYFYHALGRAARVETFDSAEIISDLETALGLGLPQHMVSQAKDILAELKPGQADCRFVAVEAVSDASLPTFMVEFHGSPGGSAIVAVMPANWDDDDQGNVTVVMIPENGIVAGQVDYSSNEGQPPPAEFEIILAYPGCKTSEIIAWP